jgi:hypothetical protein
MKAIKIDIKKVQVVINTTFDVWQLAQFYRYL